MPYSDEERKPIQMRMFGCLTEDIDDAVLGSLTYRISQDLSEARLEVAVSLLSDAQERLAHGSAITIVNQIINRAKYLIDNERSVRRQGARA